MANLNVQGLSRKYKLLMECLIAEPGSTFVSIDLAAAEPTVITHFSNDDYYYKACFGMVGKEPFYDENQVLNIDDLYLMVASVSPIGKELIWDMFFQKTYGGMSFDKAWLVSPDLIKNTIKGERAFHKILCLGLGYSMGPKHMVESAFKAGYNLSLRDAKLFFKAYWDLFKGVKQLGERLEAQFNRVGYLINSFGYRLYPDPSYKALNYFIQSSVSGLMHLLNAKFFMLAPYAQFVTVIHDELIIQVPKTRVDEAKTSMQMAVDSLNEDLGWSVKIRTGWAVGENLYEAK